MHIATEPSPSPWAALSLRSVLVALGLGLAAAAALNPIFITPFPILLGRTVFLAMALLLTYVATGAVLQRLLPSRMPAWGRQTLQVVAVAVAAPIAAFIGATVSAGGSVGTVLDTPARMLGFLWIAAVALILGLVITAAALLREREHREAEQALQFALERSRLEKQALDARMNLLQAQIEPHFLFNTLAHVQRLQETEPGRGREMLRSLIDYLRAALPSMRSSGSTLRRELDLARSFLTILQLRMGERLAFDIRADPQLLDLPVPPMVLPTLVENAVKHGLAPLTRGGRIDISAETAGEGRLAIEVADDGQGFTAASGSGVGLSNTRSRLSALFGDRATLELRSGSRAGVVARLVLPMPAPLHIDGVAA